MKKIACFLLCLLLVPSALGEHAPRKLLPEEPLYTSLRERSMELAFLFNEALHSEGYVEMFTASANFEEELTLLRMQDFTQPTDVSVVRADRAMDGDWMQEALQAVEGAGLSPALQEMLWARVYLQTGTSLIARDSGAKTLALASSLAFSDAYLCPEEMDGPCFVVMQYGGLYAFLVTFYPTVNGTMKAQAQFIPSRAADSLNWPNE